MRTQAPAPVRPTRTIPYRVRVTLRRLVLVAAVAPAMLAATACEREQPEVPDVPVPTTSADQTDGSRTPIRDEVPERCEDLIRFTRLLEVIAVPVDGSNEQIYNDDVLEGSGRTARLSCRYGVPFDLTDPNATPSPGVPPTVDPSPTPGPGPALAIAVSSYTDADIARGRVEDTVINAQGTGSQVAARPIGDVEAFMLMDSEDVSYVLADGPLTYVFTLRRGLVPAEDEESTVIAVVEEVVGVEDVTPTPTPSGSASAAPTSPTGA